MRAFISIKLPTKILMQVKEIQERLPEFIGKRTELMNLHLTLKFLGEISFEKMEETKERLKKINFNKFEVEICEIGFFDKQDHGIVWLKLSNCGALQKEVDEALNELYEKEKRFMSHLTIARIKKVKEKKNFLESLKKIEIPKLFFIVDKFYLVQSKLKKEGPEYADLESYGLK
jgi:RNA 2',3'-cyclic 3'-phosphodiesterase